MTFANSHYLISNIKKYFEVKSLFCYWLLIVFHLSVLFLLFFVFNSPDASSGCSPAGDEGREKSRFFLFLLAQRSRHCSCSSVDALLQASTCLLVYHTLETLLGDTTELLATEPMDMPSRLCWTTSAAWMCHGTSRRKNWSLATFPWGCNSNITLLSTKVQTSSYVCSSKKPAMFNDSKLMVPLVSWHDVYNLCSVLFVWLIKKHFYFL